MPRAKSTQNDVNFDLGQQIAELRGVVVEGFRGVHARQDITNGRIGKLETRVTLLESESDTSKGRRQGTWRFWLVLATIGSLVIALLGILARTGCWGLFCKG